MFNFDITIKAFPEISLEMINYIINTLFILVRLVCQHLSFLLLQLPLVLLLAQQIIMQLVESSSGWSVPVVVFIWVNSFLRSIRFFVQSSLLFSPFVVFIQVDLPLLFVALLVKSVVSLRLLSLVHHLDNLVG